MPFAMASTRMLSHIANALIAVNGDLNPRKSGGEGGFCPVLS